MKLTIDRNKLLSAISVVEKFVPSKTPIAVLTGIRFSAFNDMITLSATDLDMGIEYIIKNEESDNNTEVPLQISENGSFVVLAKIFSEITRKLSQNQIHITAKEEKIDVQCGNSHMTLPCFNDEDFPEISKSNIVFTLEFSQGIFKNMIRQVIYARAEESPSRPQLTGVLVESREGKLHMVALDGYRISWRWESLDNPNQQDFSIIIPGKTLIELSRILSDKQDETFKIFTADNRIEFRTDNVVISSRVLDGSFIDYEKVVNVEPKTQLQIDTDALESAIDRAIVLAREGSKNNLVKFQISNNMMEVSAESELGSISDKVPCECKGEDLIITFNARFFIEALRAIDTPDIDIQFSGDTGPSIIKPVGSDNYINFILPVRMR